MSESKEIKRAFDYFEGDTVRVIETGEIGIITSIRAADRWNALLYYVELKNRPQIISRLIGWQIEFVSSVEQ